MFQKHPRIRISLDIALILAVAIAGGVFASQVFKALGDDALEWRFSVVLTSFPSPVMFAAGRGMKNVDVGMIPELAAFYRSDASSFDPSLIPEDYEGFPLNGSYAYMHFYLLYAIGWAWRLFGISFHSIHLLCIILYMAMVAALYGVFRLGMGRLLSIAGTVAAAASPAYLASCPSLRDFGKAPFMLLCFFLLGIFLKKRHSRKSLLIYALLYGLAAGIGYGFRQDLLICIPAGIIIVALFTQVDDPRPRITRLAASLILLCVFLVIGFPVIYGVHLDKGSASAQAFTQGVSEIIEDRMAFGYASYTLHHHYSDYFDFTVVNSYARRTGYEEPMEAHFSAGHGEAGGKFMREVMLQFPADMFSRGLASLVALPETNEIASKETERITQPHGDLLRSRAKVYEPFARHFKRWGLVYALAALVVLSISNLRLGIAVAFLGLYFGAYPSLLYEFRHFFHLAFVPYWALGYLIAKGYQCTAWLFTGILRKEYAALSGGFSPRKIVVGAGFVLVVFGMLGGALLVLRISQRQRVDTLLVHYENAVLEPVEAVWSRKGNDILLRPALPLPGLQATESLPPFESAGEYLALSLKHTGYPMRFQLLYEKNPMTDFSQWCAPQPGLAGKTGHSLFFFPVYELVWPAGEETVRGKFSGILIPEQCRGMVKALYRVKNNVDFRLWPFLALPEHKSAFLDCKTGPFERFIAAAWVEASSCFGLRSEAAIHGYRRLIRQYPGYTPFEERGFSLIRNCANPKHALDLCSQLLDEFPCLQVRAAADIDLLMERAKNKGLEAPQIVPCDPWVLTQRGLQFEKEGKHEEAGDLYRRALKATPSLMFAAENLDKYLQQHCSPEERLEEWKILQECYSHSRVIGLFYGMALRGTEQLDDAAAYFQEMVESSLGYQDDAQLQLAATNIMRGKQEAGIAAITQALDTFPEKTKTAAALCNEAGRYFMKQQDYDSAIVLFGMACDLDQDDMWPCVAQGEAFAASGLIAQAKQTYKEVLGKAPESPYTAFKLDALFEAAEIEERIAFWRELQEAHLGAAIPLLYLGKAKEDAGDDAGAYAAYRKALEINPSLEDAQSGLARLEAAAAAKGE